MDEVVTPSANGFGSDDEDMMLWVGVCSHVHVEGMVFVMSLAAEPKYDDLGVLSVSV